MIYAVSPTRSVSHYCPLLSLLLHSSRTVRGSSRAKRQFKGRKSSSAEKAVAVQERRKKRRSSWSQRTLRNYQR
jgi:hypothetical protein